MSLLFSFIGSLLGTSVALVIGFVIIYNQLNKQTDKDGNVILTEETPEQSHLFDEDSKNIINYCLKKNLNITIQPNFENVMWVFHHTDKGELYSICPMIPGTYVQMVNKVDNYIIHMKQQQEEMKKNVTN